LWTRHLDTITQLKEYRAVRDGCQREKRETGGDALWVAEVRG